MSKVQEKREQREEAIAFLRKNIPAGTTIYGIVRNVSASGMSRRIDFYAFLVPKGSKSVQTFYLTGYFARVLGWRLTARGLHVNGCGMDMIFHTVYETAGVVFKDHSTSHHANGTQWRSEQL